MYIFIGLFYLVLELIPLFLFIWLIIYLAKNKNPSVGNADINSTDTSNNSLKTNNSEINKKIGLVAVFLLVAIPCWFAWMIFIGVGCSGPNACKGGMPFGMEVLMWIPMIFIGWIIYLILSGDKSSTIKDTKIQKYEGGNPQDTNSQVVSVIQSFSTTDIDSIHFAEKSGKSYTIKLDSIKKIAKYIEYKYHKNTFNPNELVLEKDFLIQNYTSDLSEENYNLVVTTLSNWVSTGGKFDIIMRK